MIVGSHFRFLKVYQVGRPTSERFTPVLQSKETAAPASNVGPDASRHYFRHIIIEVNPTLAAISEPHLVVRSAVTSGEILSSINSMKEGGMA